tara:strand:+ start:790 stop:1284 length:495 start_codon:yes stop_codon:yes gene_type:complete
MKKFKIWKLVKKDTYKDVNDCIKKLKKSGIILSPWIENIFKNKKNNIIYNYKNYELYKVKVSDLGFSRATKLKNIYFRIKKINYSLVPPDVALRTRKLYKNQKRGEWIRFATPFNSMIDNDNIPHLPKLGSALGKLFIETYWSYPDAVFYPHNEFIITKEKKNK